jgi:hypothetical protein
VGKRLDLIDAIIPHGLQGTRHRITASINCRRA